MKLIPAIEIVNLTVVYNENTPYEITVLKDFSLQIKQGEALIITGGNGSGKTTLLNAIAGTIPIKSGKILINGKDVTKWSSVKRAKLMGFVHQDTMLGTCPNLSLYENFQLTNTKSWWKPAPYKLRLTEGQFDNVAKIGLGLETRNNTKINMFSGGQRQALAVCLSFESKKTVLLFDEFTSALDELTKFNILDYSFEQAKKNFSTLLIVTHNILDFKNYSCKALKL